MCGMSERWSLGGMPDHVTHTTVLSSGDCMSSLFVLIIYIDIQYIRSELQIRLIHILSRGGGDAGFPKSL